ncbi:MAG: hypothetical protein R6T92_12350 [Desulfosalsimonadaceae bacterium]
MPQYFITMAVDITDRKQSEDELRKLKEHLETEVAEKNKAAEKPGDGSIALWQCHHLNGRFG